VIGGGCQHFSKYSAQITFSLGWPPIKGYGNKVGVHTFFFLSKLMHA